jgi:class 3 adenylate cyclase
MWYKYRCQSHHPRESLEISEIMTSPLNPSRYPEERRFATVLFADVTSFTAIAEKLDFETVSDLIKSIWLRLDAIVESYNGYIDKHTGDGVMVVWGAPYAGDNDAEQAVSAALAMQASLEEFASQTSIPGVDKLRLRVGINSGSVFAGYVGIREEYTMIGDTVNVASRLEQFTEPGTVAISENTFRLVRGAFHVRRLMPFSVKGKTEPVVAYLVEARNVSPTRVRYSSYESMETCMVGRDHELEQLCSYYNQSLRSESPTMVLVTGEAGLGKSRLLMEFTNKLEMDDPNITILSIRALTQTMQVPFYLWKSLWQTRFELHEEDQADVNRSKFLRELQRLWGGQLGPISVIEVAHLVGSLIGLEWPDSQYLVVYENDPEERLQRTSQLMRLMLQRFCAFRPTILLLDDLQWADVGSLELLASLFQPSDQPLSILVLGSARPEFLRQYPRWPNIAGLIQLSPLAVNARIVAAAYPELRSIPETVLTELAKRAEGNPYFLEEMVKGLLKAGLTESNQEPDAILTRLHSQLPESLRGMLQARLDALTREARSVALLASVIGRVFWVGPIIAAARTTAGFGTGPLGVMPPMVIDRVVQDGLRQLVRAELAFPLGGSQFSQEQEYIFKNTFLRDVAYSLIPHKNLSQYHLAVANWLADHADSDFQVMAAEHYEQGGAIQDAARQYEKASRLARMRGSSSEAKSLHARAEVLSNQGVVPKQV